MQAQKRISRFSSKNALSVAQPALVTNRCLISREASIFETSQQMKMAGSQKSHGPFAYGSKLFLEPSIPFEPSRRALQLSTWSQSLKRHGTKPTK